MLHQKNLNKEKEINNKYNMKSLSELNNLELTDLLVKGHIGNDTKDIAELHFFYNSVKEEIKRRDLNERYRRNNKSA